MKYTKEQRLDIAKRVYDGELTVEEAAVKYELIDALVMARINEARLKKGYSVKGSGVEKEYLPIASGNTK